jgi:hypothetical protein
MKNVLQITSDIMSVLSICFMFWGVVTQYRIFKFKGHMLVESKNHESFAYSHEYVRLLTTGIAIWIWTLIFLGSSDALEGCIRNFLK